MADSKYVPSSNDNTIGAGVAGDAIKWGAKGNKVVMCSVMDLTFDPNLNIRFRQGSEIYGMKLEKDSYDIPGMRQQLTDGFGIREPITASLRKDGSKVVLRGNRRTVAGQEMANDPLTPDALRTVLLTQTPVILLTGLTEAQERELVNDQTTKRFLRSEVVRYIFSLRRQQWNFERIALLLWETLGQFTGNTKKIAEIRDISDAGLKREKIRSWLRGSLDCYLIWGYDLGMLVQKTILLSEMQIDGLLTDNGEKPYFKATTASQDRIAALKKAKEADGSKWNGMTLIEGSEFKKVFDKFHDEDYGPKTESTTVKATKMLGRGAIEGMAELFMSKVGRMLIQRILGKEQPELPTADEFCAMIETKMQLLESQLAGLNPNVAAIVRACLVNPDPEDFRRFLADNQMPASVPPVEPPADETVAAPAGDDGNDEFKLG